VQFVLKYLNTLRTEKPLCKATRWQTQNRIARALICKKTVSLLFLPFEDYQEKARKWAARLREAQTSRRTDYCMLEGRLGQQSTEALRQRFAGRG